MFDPNEVKEDAQVHAMYLRELLDSEVPLEAAISMSNSYIVAFKMNTRYSKEPLPRESIAPAPPKPIGPANRERTEGEQPDRSTS